jgi:hypothetical protein
VRTPLADRAGERLASQLRTLGKFHRPPRRRGRRGR